MPFVVRNITNLNILGGKKGDFSMVKTACFFEYPVKTEIDKNAVLVFPNSFISFFQFLPVFLDKVKTAKTTVFHLLPTIYSR